MLSCWLLVVIESSIMFDYVWSNPRGIEFGFVIIFLRKESEFIWRDEWSGFLYSVWIGEFGDGGSNRLGLNISGGVLIIL